MTSLVPTVASGTGRRVPGASVIGRFGSLIGRIKSLFAHLGNLPGKPLNYSVLRRSDRRFWAAEPADSQFLPVDQGTGPASVTAPARRIDALGPAP